MPLQANIQQEIVKLQQTSGFVELYKLDATAAGGAIYYFTNNQSPNGGNIVFGGITYQSLPIISSGWDISTEGVPPKPTLQLSNVNKTLLVAVATLGDLVGSEVSRTRTYAKFLDVATFTRRNLLAYSEDFSNDAWVKTNSTTTNNTSVAPNGMTTADTFTRTATGNHAIRQLVTTTTAGLTFTFSVWLKAGTLTGNVVLRIREGNNTTNVATLTVTPTSEWTRFTVTGTFAGTPSSANLIAQIDPVDNVGVAGETLFVWGAQVEQAATASDYQFTAANHQPDANPAAYIGPDVYQIERKTYHDNEMIEFQLTSSLDRLGMRIPRRQILKDATSFNLYAPGVARTRVSR